LLFGWCGFVIPHLQICTFDIHFAEDFISECLSLTNYRSLTSREIICWIQLPRLQSLERRFVLEKRFARPDTNAPAFALRCAANRNPASQAEEAG
jgi:hypothetical protein